MLPGHFDNNKMKRTNFRRVVKNTKRRSGYNRKAIVSPKRKSSFRQIIMSTWRTYNSLPRQRQQFDNDVNNAFRNRQFIIQVSIDKYGNARYYIVPHTLKDWKAIGNLQDWIDINSRVWRLNGTLEDIVKFLGEGRKVEYTTDNFPDIDLRIRKEIRGNMYERDYVNLCVLRIDSNIADYINTRFSGNEHNGIISWDSLNPFDKMNLCNQLVLERDKEVSGKTINQLSDMIRAEMDSKSSNLYVLYKDNRERKRIYNWIGGKVSLKEMLLIDNLFGSQVNEENKFRAASILGMIREFGEELGLTRVSSDDEIKEYIIYKFLKNIEIQIECKYRKDSTNLNIIFSDYNDYTLREYIEGYIEARLPVIAYGKSF